MKTDQSPERQIIRALQEVLCEFSLIIDNYGGRTRNYEIRLKQNKLVISDRDDDVEAMIKQFNFYHDKIETEEGNTSWMVEKLIDIAIKMTELLNFSFPMDRRPELWLMRTESGELTANFIEMHSADTRLKIEEVNFHRRKISTIEKTTHTMPIRWIGTDRQWGDVIIRLYEDGLIKADGSQDALNLAATHFIKKNGDRFNPKSVRQNLKNRSDIEGK